jgi:hypothetical protein
MEFDLLLVASPSTISLQVFVSAFPEDWTVLQDEVKGRRRQ